MGCSMIVNLNGPVRVFLSCPSSCFCTLVRLPLCRLRRGRGRAGVFGRMFVGMNECKFVCLRVSQCANTWIGLQRRTSL